MVRLIKGFHGSVVIDERSRLSARRRRFFPPFPFRPERNLRLQDCLNETAFFSVASNPSSLSFPRSQVTATVRVPRRETRHYRSGDLALVPRATCSDFPPIKRMTVKLVRCTGSRGEERERESARKKEGEIGAVELEGERFNAAIKPALTVSRGRGGITRAVPGPWIMRRLKFHPSIKSDAR